MSFSDEKFYYGVGLQVMLASGDDIQVYKRYFCPQKGKQMNLINEEKGQKKKEIMF